MFKKIILLILIIICCVALCSCTKETKTIIIESKEKSSDNGQQSQKTEFEIVHNESNENNKSKVTIERNDKVEEDVYLSQNDKITKDGKYEIVYKGHGISKTVYPPNRSGYYRYYEAEKDGHQYLYLIIEYKNLKETDVRADKAGSVAIKYADKYEYTGFSVFVDDDGDFTYSNIRDIEPLTTSKIYYLIDIPEEVINSEESIVATYTVGSETFKIQIR